MVSDKDGERSERRIAMRWSTDSLTTFFAQDLLIDHIKQVRFRRSGPDDDAADGAP